MSDNERNISIKLKNVSIDINSIIDLIQNRKSNNDFSNNENLEYVILCLKNLNENVKKIKDLDIQDDTLYNLNIGIYKSIKLIPTHINLDIYYCNNTDNLARYFSKKYGESYEYWRNCDLGSIPGYCLRIPINYDGDISNDLRLILLLNEFSYSNLVHEINHVYYHICDIIGMKLNQKSQEIHSYYLDYLFDECVNINSFKSCSEILNKIYE